jgi:hypothetical protein
LTPALDRKQRRSLIALVATVCAIIVLLGVFRLLSGLLVEYWWFTSLGHGGVYLRILATKLWLWCLGFVLTFAAAVAGFLLARRSTGPVLVADVQWGEFRFSLAAARRVVNALFWAGAAVAGLLGGSALIPLWHRALLFLNRVPFGQADPIYEKDIGFYVFTYPLLAYARGMLVVLAWVSLISAGAYYVFSGALAAGRLRALPRRAFSHLNRTIGLIFLLVAAGFFLDRYELLYSTAGVSYGAGYTDLRARLPACWIMVVSSLAVAVVFFVTTSPARVKRVLVALGVWVGLWVLARGGYPAFLQSVRVSPNELELEKPYIAHMIAHTSAAYGLDAMREVQYPVAEDLGYQDVLADSATIGNVRLWDWRPLRDTYRQIQAIRSYYEFNDVDVDRYRFAGAYTQTLLSVREMEQRKLTPEARTWVNERLQYTHGYGLCLSPVNEATEDGLPVLTVKDIPPTGPAELEVTQPRLYYGESTRDYVFANTATEEFDYPMGDSNVRNRYGGQGGVPVAGMLRKLMYALSFGDVKVLLSDDLVAGSRVLYHRHIRERVNRLAPYLRLDADPYPVLFEGRIVWVQDAYTTTRLYPYSQPSRKARLNYIRNSVKAVVDAYEGSVTLYVADPDDALIRCYSRIFPGLYTPMEEMPDRLRGHLRYPEMLFDIQAEKYATFHMRDPGVFYNQEDVWEVAFERYRGQEQPVRAYYIIMRLPGSEEPEFLVMLPFTPQGRDNMIAWLAGRCDGEHYGELVGYRFPKGKLVAGPLQVEGWIDQDPEISQQLTLWGQGGSSVIRGNLLVIPIAGGILYVEPLYIQAEAGAIPQLKRVLTAYGKRVAMAETLAGSLAALFGEGAAPTRAPPPAERVAPRGEAADLLQEALNHYARAQEALREADWEAYGREMRGMKQVLDALQDELPSPE